MADEDVVDAEEELSEEDAVELVVDSAELDVVLVEDVVGSGVQVEEVVFSVVDVVVGSGGGVEVVFGGLVVVGLGSSPFPNDQVPKN